MIVSNLLLSCHELRGKQHFVVTVPLHALIHNLPSSPVKFIKVHTDMHVGLVTARVISWQSASSEGRLENVPALSR